MTSENRKEFAHLTLKSCKKAFREYITNYDVKILTKIEKNFIRNLILLWNDYKDDWNPILRYMESNIRASYTIKDKLFNAYNLKFATLYKLNERYADIYARGMLKKKKARRYITLTNEFIDDAPCFYSNRSLLKTDAIIILSMFDRHPVMNYTN